jgi:hypothetical protein
MAKNSYWHMVVEEGKDTPEFNIGRCITHPFIHDGYKLPMVDKDGKGLKDTSKLKYLGMVNNSLPGEELKQKLLEFAKKKDLVKHCTWMKKMVAEE